MLISYQKRTYCLFIDWLSFSGKRADVMQEPKCPDGYRMELYEGNNIFKNRAIIFDNEGSKLITMLWNPHSSLLDKALITFQFSNEVLYFEREKECLELTYKSVDYQFNSFSRIDFAMDFEADKRQQGIIKKLFNGAMYVQGKKEGSIFWHESNYEGKQLRQAHCLSWGSPTSKIRCKLYNKSREQNQLEENGLADKPYIIEIWKSAKFDIKNVWRLEFSLNAVGQLKWHDKVVTWEDYFDCEWWYEVYLSLYQNRFITRVNEGKKNGHKNEDTVSMLLKLPEVYGKLQWKKNQNPIEKPEIISAIRRAIRELSEPYCLANQDIFNSVATNLINIVEVSRMGGYFQKITGKQVEQYCKDIYEQVGDGVVEMDIKPSTFWD